MSVQKKKAKLVLQYRSGTRSSNDVGTDATATQDELIRYNDITAAQVQQHEQISHLITEQQQLHLKIQLQKEEIVKLQELVSLPRQMDYPVAKISKLSQINCDQMR